MNTYKILLLVCASMPFVNSATEEDPKFKIFQSTLPTIYCLCFEEHPELNLPHPTTECDTLATHYAKAQPFIEAEQAERRTYNNLTTLSNSNQLPALKDAIDAARHKIASYSKSYIATQCSNNDRQEIYAAKKAIFNYAMMFVAFASKRPLDLNNKHHMKDLMQLNKEAELLNEYFPETTNK